MKTIFYMFMVVIVASLMVEPNVTAAQESDCDGLEGAEWQLCNAYCEALDCDVPNNQDSQIPCERTLSNFRKITGGNNPPCYIECPCFTAEDIDIFLDMGGWTYPKESSLIHYNDRHDRQYGESFELHTSVNASQSSDYDGSHVMISAMGAWNTGYDYGRCHVRLGSEVYEVYSGLSKKEVRKCRQEILNSKLWNTCTP